MYVTRIYPGEGCFISFQQVFIATAFVTCDSTMGWSVATAAVFHELAQEISDYVVLTSPTQANLKPHQALLLNFLSGSSVLLGTLDFPAQSGRLRFNN